MTGRDVLLADRLAIADVLARYARAIDRCDPALLAGVWWPEATCDYGSGPLPAAAWAEATLAALGAMLRTQHFLGQTLVTFDGATATAETYCRAWHEAETPSGRVEMEVGGRYLDTLEKRDGEWRISRRRYVMDWNRNGPSSCRWEGPLYGTLTRHGARAPDDPSMTGA
jgi:hypothetical protein